jgi:prepilin-type N-terminal cleavage/methylation domain-containing protein
MRLKDLNPLYAKLERQRGVTLAEVLVVIIIVVILIMISGVGITLFFRKYKELNMWAELQKDGLQCLNTIKNGVPVGSGNNLEFYGVTNALRLQLTNTTTNVASGLRVTPPTPQGLETPDFAYYYLYDGAVRCTYVHHGVQVASPLYIFPPRDRLDDMVIDKFEFTQLNSDRECLAVLVELQARVKTGKDKEDYRAIKFKTKMVKK